MEVSQQKTGISFPVTGGNIIIDRGTGYVIGCDKTVTEARIPEEAEGIKITGIREYAFNYCDELTKVTIPSTVIHLSSGAFWGRNILKNVYVAGDNLEFKDEDGVIYSKDGKTLIFYPGFHSDEYEILPGTERIAKGAFYNCTNIKSIKLPDSILSLQGSFYGCTALKSIKLPARLTVIGDGAFGNCKSLETISLPYSVQRIDGSAFSGCTALKSIKVNSDNIYYTDVDGVLFTKDRSTLLTYPNAHSESYEIPSSTMTIGPWAFAKCDNLTEVIIPSSVTKIEQWAFGDCSSLKDIIIPDSVSILGKRAFWHCEKLEKVMFSNNIETIDDYCFAACSSLRAITIPEGVKTIGMGAFSYCYALKDILLPDTLTSIVSQAFESCTAIPSVTIPSSVKYMGRAVFKGCWDLFTVYCNHKSVADDETLYPENTEFIYTGEEEAKEDKDLIAYPVKGGNAYFKKSIGAFTDCDMYVTSITIPEKVENITVRSIGSSAFLSCSRLSEVVLPKTIEEIGSNAFDSCTALRKINIPQGIKKIGKGAFNNCIDLETIEFPESLAKIGGCLFSGCKKLKNIKVSPENNSFTDENGVFYSRDRSILISYPAGKQQEEYTIEPTTRTIYDNAFDECVNLKKIELCPKLTRIGDGAFSRCYSLKSIIIPSGVRVLGSFAFEHCKNLSDVDIPDSIKTFDEFVFDDCPNLSIVYCDKGSFADNKEHYPSGDVVFVYLRQ